jgi:DNA-binding NarL/FixJ family response regulator
MQQVFRPLKLVIADDSAMVRGRLKGLLASVPDVEVVAETANVTTTLDAIRSLKPDAVTLDVRMPPTNGLNVLKTMREEHLHAVVIVLTNYPFAEYKERALALGARAFLHKSSDFERVPALLHELSRQLQH